jgi:hypothetical protein
MYMEMYMAMNTDMYKNMFPDIYKDMQTDSKMDMYSLDTNIYMDMDDYRIGFC